MSNAASPGNTDRAIEEGWRKQVTKVIAHVDLDAFYTQVEVKNNPKDLQGKPVAVVQYNPFGDLSTHTPEEKRIYNDSNGSLIAVSYEARRCGVKRNHRGDEARKHCPDLQLVQVPTAHGKADLTHYRSAGKQVTDILARLAVCEKASIDECYLDITAEAKRRLDAFETMQLPVNPQQVHVSGQDTCEGWYERPMDEWGDGESLLAHGANAVAELRAAVLSELGFSCSAGIAHCKILAKLASGMHKPSQQTLVAAAAVPGLLSDLAIPKLRQLGGKFGDDVMKTLNLQTVGELAAIPKQRLESLFGTSQAQRLFDLAHGIDADEVKQRTLPKSISCGKTFQGPNKLRSLPEVHKWLKELGHELEERVSVDRAENAREPKLLTVHVGWPQISRSCSLRRPMADVIAEDCLALLKKWANATPGWSITGMSVGVSNFQAAPTGKSTLARFFSAAPNAAAKKAKNQHPRTLEKVSNNSLDSEPFSDSAARMDRGTRQLASDPSDQLALEASEAGPKGGAKHVQQGDGAAALQDHGQQHAQALQTRQEQLPAMNQPEVTAVHKENSYTAGLRFPWEAADDSIILREDPLCQRRLNLDTGERQGDALPAATVQETIQTGNSREDSLSSVDLPVQQAAFPQAELQDVQSGANEAVDPDVLASLPADIQRELKLASMMRMGTAKSEHNSVQHKTQPRMEPQRARTKQKKKPSIASFFPSK